MKKTATINMFTHMFHIIYDTFMSGIIPVLSNRIGQNWEMTVNMTPRAAEFWNGNVWEDWKERFPNCANWIDNYPRDDVLVNVVQLSYN